MTTSFDLSKVTVYSNANESIFFAPSEHLRGERRIDQWAHSFVGTFGWMPEVQSEQDWIDSIRNGEAKQTREQSCVKDVSGTGSFFKMHNDTISVELSPEKGCMIAFVLVLDDFITSRTQYIDPSIDEDQIDVLEDSNGSFASVKHQLKIFMCDIDSSVNIVGPGVCIKYYLPLLEYVKMAIRAQCTSQAHFPSTLQAYKDIAGEKQKIRTHLMKYISIFD